VRGGQRLGAASLMSSTKSAIRAAFPARSVVRDGSGSWAPLPPGSPECPPVTRRFACRSAYAVERAAACRLQASCPGWLVMWSPWRRKFTAFACFSCDPLIIDELTPALLLEQMHRAVMRSTVPAGRW
jgi:hypothetical protein